VGLLFPSSIVSSFPEYSKAKAKNEYDKDYRLPSELFAPKRELL
jgi:hypothetical protein